MKNLYLIRGIPGSGKTTLAEVICKDVVSADDYFMQNGVYNYDGSKIKLAHEWCLNQTKSFMDSGKEVAVANTFTREWEMKAYYDLAKEMDYTVFSIIVENRHNGKNVHDVPEEHIEKMKNRFEVKL